MEKLEEIKLYPRHFKTLEVDTEDFGNNFMNPTKCPLAKALKEIYPKNRVSVGAISYWLDDRRICTRYIGFSVISNAAIRLKNGEEFVTIKL